VEFAVLAALAVLFASFSTPILAGSYALASSSSATCCRT